MKIKGIRIEQLINTVLDIGYEHYANNILFKRWPDRTGNFLNFTLTVRKSANAGGRRSATGRKVAAACWHAHRDIMAELFRINPQALLVTALTRYDGAADFYETFESTGDGNIGSIAQPLAMRDACECDDCYGDAPKRLGCYS